MKQKRKKAEENISQYRRNFYNIYHTNIVPMFSELEILRKKELSKLILLELVLTSVFLATVYIFFHKSELTGGTFCAALEVFIPVILITSVGVGVILVFYFDTNFVQSLKLQCMDKVVNAFGNLKWMNKSNLISDNEVVKSQLFSIYNRRKACDAFQGKYNDVTFEISETEMWHESGSGKNRSVVQVFKGVIIKFKANKDIKATTIIATKGDKNIKNRYSIPVLSACACYILSGNISFTIKTLLWFLIVFLFVAVIIRLIGKFYKGKDELELEEIKLEDPEFTKKYRAYSTDQVEGRYLITPAFMQRFKNIQTAFGTNKVKCSFYGDNLMFAISTRRNLFEIGNLFRSLNNPKQMTTFFNELSSILSLIDYFKLDENTRL